MIDPDYIEDTSLELLDQDIAMERQDYLLLQEYERIQSLYENLVCYGCSFDELNTLTVKQLEIENQRFTNLIHFI